MLEKIWKKILRRKGLSLWIIPAVLLWAISLVYRLGFLLKQKRATRPIKVKVPVISIGNIAVGGTGKTPILLTIAKFLSSEGFKVGIVSSGYGRSSSISFVKPGYQVVEMPIEETGDEVMLLADALPDAVFSVDNSKAIAAQKLANSSDRIDTVLVDDGFQHFALYRDFDIVTYDAAVPPSQIKMFPFGILREPLGALKRANAIIITRAKFAKDIEKLRDKISRIAPQSELYLAKFGLENLVGNKQKFPLKYIEGKSVFVFAGIGNFRAFIRQIRGLTRDISHALELSDHQVYDDDTLNRIKTLAHKKNSEIILTTAKDWFKVRHFDFGRELYYISQAIDIDPGEEKLVSHLLESIGLTKKVG